MKFQTMREAVCSVNRELFVSGLARFTFGNASGADREAGVAVIKPSGMSYDDMGPAEMVAVSLASGKRVDGRARPSSDTATHLALYQSFPGIYGVVHTHSRYATVFAQAMKSIPCVGTTHADTFHGAVPVTRMLTLSEVQEEYEANTGRVIAELFEKESLDPATLPGVLVAGHGPFAWGRSVGEALEHALILEEVARLAYCTLALRPDQKPLPHYLMDKHFLRKHGADAYYGQQEPDEKPPRQS